MLAEFLMLSTTLERCKHEKVGRSTSCTGISLENTCLFRDTHEKKEEYMIISQKRLLLHRTIFHSWPYHLIKFRA